MHAFCVIRHKWCWWWGSAICFRIIRRETLDYGSSAYYVYKSILSPQPWCKWFQISSRLGFETEADLVVLMDSPSLEIWEDRRLALLVLLDLSGVLNLFIRNCFWSCRHGVTVHGKHAKLCFEVALLLFNKMTEEGGVELASPYCIL